MTFEKAMKALKAGQIVERTAYELAGVEVIQCRQGDHPLWHWRRSGHTLVDDIGNAWSAWEKVFFGVHDFSATDWRVVTQKGSVGAKEEK